MNRVAVKLSFFHDRYEVLSDISLKFIKLNTLDSACSVHVFTVKIITIVKSHFC